MDLNELAERLALVENRDVERSQAEERRGFIDKYGTMFSGDEGIGTAILAEMNRRGIPSAAVGADRVVQEILDSIRQEASAILDKIKSDTATVNNLIDQVQDIQDSVAAATEGGVPGDGVLDMPVPMDDIPMPDAEAGMEMPVPMEEGPPVEDVPVPMEEAPAEEELPPEIVPSDIRVKRVQPRPKGIRPSAHILSAIQGGK